MLDNLKVGTEYRSEITVEAKDTAAAMGSGALEVFSTPCMVALMENAAFSLLKQEPYNEDSVGTLVNVAHTRACRVGTKVWAVATVTEVNGRKVSFDVKAFDEKGEIGGGKHERFTIIPDKFMSKL